MKLPRNVTGEELIRALRRFGYVVTRQTGTLSSILKEFGARHGMIVEDVVRKLSL